MEPIRSIAELPFRRREALDLLNLREERDAPDLDYTGFGYARIGEVWLEERSGARRAVRDALIVALHCTDANATHVIVTTSGPVGESGPACDIEVEFFIDEVAPGYSVTAPLSAFLATWLPRLQGDGAPCAPASRDSGGIGVAVPPAAAVVLALCNPRQVAIRRPPALGATPLLHAVGDVDSWLDPDGRVRLVADRWRVAR